MANYEILIIDRYGELVTSFREFSSLSILDTANDVGKWEVRSRTPYRQPFPQSSFAIIFRDGVHIFGGPVNQITEEYDYATKIWTWQVSGYGFNAVLKNLLIYPSAFDNYAFTDRDFTATNVITRDLIVRLINENASYENHLNSHIPGYPLISGAKAVSAGGGSSDLTCRFANLLTTCKDLATANGLFILPIYDKTTGKVTFVVYGLPYVNQRIRFTADTGGVIPYSRTYTEPDVTRIVVSYNDDLYWQNVYEAAVYQNVMPYPNFQELFVKPSKEQVAQTSLSDLAAQTAKEYAVDMVRYDITVNPDGYVYGYDFDSENDVFTTDYRIGDIVTIGLPGEEFTARIMQMKIDVAYGKETMTPVFGDVTRGKFNGIFANLRNLNSSVSKSDNTEISS